MGKSINQFVSADFSDRFVEVTVMTLLFVEDLSLYSKLVVDIFISDHSKCISPIFVVSRVLVCGGVVVYPMVVGPVPAQVRTMICGYIKFEYMYKTEYEQI